MTRASIAKSGGVLKMFQGVNIIMKIKFSVKMEILLKQPCFASLSQSLASFSQLTN